MNRLFVTLPLACICLAACGQRAAEVDTQDYQAVRARFGELYQQERYAEAAELLEPALAQFPDQVMANAYNLAIVYDRTAEHAKGMDALRFAHERGIWFHVRAFDQPLWNEYRKQSGFEAIVARNTALWQEAQRIAGPKMLVTVPQGSETGRTYPLFIALHGGGGNMTEFRDVWKSDVLSNEFVTAYLQSSQVVAMDGYSWTENMETARCEITEQYDEIRGRYPVNEDQVVVGGFSSGGMAALEVMLANDIPVVGFVALCPAHIDGFTAPAVA